MMTDLVPPVIRVPHFDFGKKLDIARAEGGKLRPVGKKILHELRLCLNIWSWFNRKLRDRLIGLL